MSDQIKCPWLFSLGIAGAIASNPAMADLTDGASVTVTARNFYLDRDYKGESPQSAAREWAQGFILRANSGFTEGPVGFGLDLTGMIGVKLDSSPDRTGTQLLAYDPQDREARDEYSEMGVALKAKVSETKLAVGTHFPSLPVI
ncbi:OprD family outer membrane porin, partial [Pseudomonas aeruginosa]